MQNLKRTNRSALLYTFKLPAFFNFFFFFFLSFLQVDKQILYFIFTSQIFVQIVSTLIQTQPNSFNLTAVCIRIAKHVMSEDNNQYENLLVRAKAITLPKSRLTVAKIFQHQFEKNQTIESFNNWFYDGSVNCHFNYFNL